MTDLLTRIFDAARGAAAHPGEAMAIDDLRRDLQAITDAVAASDWTLDEVPDILTAFADLSAAVTVQPFDLSTDDDGSNPVVTETTPSAFVDWLANLEKLA